jgi:hypothetical protein
MPESQTRLHVADPSIGEWENPAHAEIARRIVDLCSEKTLTMAEVYRQLPWNEYRIWKVIERLAEEGTLWFMGDSAGQALA